MGRKVFVSYRYADSNVAPLNGALSGTTVRDYVDLLEIGLGRNNVYKGEHDGEDLSYLSDDTIAEKLKDRIYDSSVTVVLVSPGMLDKGRSERDQWIPWEISYSIRKVTRGGRTSQRNAIVAVILPNRHGSYDYADGRNRSFVMPDILWKNIDSGYVHVVRWYDFKGNYGRHIETALTRRVFVSEANIKKDI